jgi:hypothetical protein
MRGEISAEHTEAATARLIMMMVEVQRYRVRYR